MTYREPLPAECPPDEAEEIFGVRSVFRLVHNNPPIDDDFRSQRAVKPNNSFTVSECQARGLSVFSEREAAERQLTRPNRSGMLVCRVTLDRGAGRIQQTNRKAHYTWWPLADFDIPANCEMVES
jgi:hypothetical protein